MAAAFDGDKIHLFADAVFYDDDGTITAIHPKIWKVPGLNAAFISRGQGRAFPYFQHLVELAAPETWDDLKDILPLIWKGLDEWMDGTPMDIILAGFSESQDRPELLYRHTVRDDPEGFLAAGPTYIYLDGVVSYGCVMNVSDDICAEAIRAFDAARSERADINGFYNNRQPCLAHAVGGRLQHAILTRDGATAETLKKWPDRIGERIQPLAA